MEADPGYSTPFSRLRERLERDEHEEEWEAAAKEVEPVERGSFLGPLSFLAKVPLAVWILLGLFSGFALGYLFPDLGFIGQGVKDVFGHLADAAPLIIFFTITPALVAMYKTSSAGKFAVYVVAGFTASTLLGGLFALLLTLLFFPSVTLGLGAEGLIGEIQKILRTTAGLVFTVPVFRAIWGALAVSVLLYFGGHMRGEAPKNPFGRMLRTIADIYELIGVHGVAALGKVIKAIMPLALVAIGIFLVITLPADIQTAIDEVDGLESPPWGPLEAYFLSIGVLVVVTLLWLSLVAFAITQYTRFPLKRLLREYVSVVYPFAWSTSSSNASLPLNMERARSGLGVRSQVRSFVLPIGATVNLDGSMMAAVVATVVAGKMVGYTPSIVDLMIALVPLFFITVGTPGIPNGLAVVSAPVMAAVLPLSPEQTALFGPVYLALLVGLSDMFRTAVNTLDNGFLALLLDKWWPERFEPGAEPNPFMQSTERHTETLGRPFEAPTPLVDDDRVT